MIARLPTRAIIRAAPDRMSTLGRGPAIAGGLLPH
jgi:hypothetical protein